jgi:hypothetical protein
MLAGCQTSLWVPVTLLLLQRCFHTTGLQRPRSQYWETAGRRQVTSCSYPRSRPAAASSSCCSPCTVCQPARASPPRSIVAQRPSTQSRGCLHRFCSSTDVGNVHTALASRVPYGRSALEEESRWCVVRAASVGRLPARDSLPSIPKMRTRALGPQASSAFASGKRHRAHVLLLPLSQRRSRLFCHPHRRLSKASHAPISF